MELLESQGFLQGREMNVFRNAVLSIAMIYCLTGCESDFERCVKAESDRASKRMISELGDELSLELLKLKIFHYKEEAIVIASSRFMEVLQSNEEVREALGVSSVKDAVKAFEFREWTENMEGAGVTPQSWEDIAVYREGMAKSFERHVLPWTKIRLTSAEVRENSNLRLKALEEAEEAYYAKVNRIISEASGLAREKCGRKG